MELVPRNATILNGQSLSDIIDLEGARLVGLNIDAWTAAALTFQTLLDDDPLKTVAWQNLYDEGGNEINYTVSASRAIRFTNPGFWLGVRFIRLRSGTAAAPVNQGATRTIRLIVVP